MTDLVCDTSGLLAFLDADDPSHADVVRLVRQFAGPLVLSPLVVAELDYLVRARLGVDVARAFADDVAAESYLLIPLTSEGLRRCVALDRRYADLGLGLTDCHVMTLADTPEPSPVLTLDLRHFRAVTDSSGRALRLLPADA